MTNSQISGLESSLPNGSITHVADSRNKAHAGTRKESTLTDQLGIIKNQSMLHSYDPNDTEGLKIEIEKKISIDIKPKQSHQILQN